MREIGPSVGDVALARWPNHRLLDDATCGVQNNNNNATAVTTHRKHESTLLVSGNYLPITY
jgi:hypothetical protein